jgi:hypothetical protein
MRKRRILEMQSRTAKKLLSAIAMLLISSLMLSTVSYAWIVMSVAPEVREIHTTAGANGYLEIALQSGVGNSTSTRAEPQHNAGDSLQADREKNKTWGNMVDLSTAYGLDKITLYPSRLNMADLTTGKVNTGSYLSVPSFGTDGRIVEMNGASFVTYDPGASTPFTEGRSFGVNILGTVSGDAPESETVTYHYRRSMIRDEAAGYLEQYRSGLRTQMINLLETEQVGIFNILLRASQLISGAGQLTGDTWTADNVATAKRIIDRMFGITRESEVSLKWALLALAVADDTTYPPDDETALAALGNLYREFLIYPLSGQEKSIRSIAETNGYTDLVSAIDSILRAENQLSLAKVEIYNNDTVSNAFLKIIDVQNTFLKNGSELEPDGPGRGNPATGTTHRVYEVVDPNVKLQGQPARGIYYNYVKKYYSDYLYFAGAPSGTTTGLFSIMADLLGDFQATNQAYFKSSSPFEFRAENNSTNSWKQWTMYLRATGKTSVAQFSEAANRGVLGTVYDEIQSYDPGSAMISFSVSKVDAIAYGYSVDLVFRSSKQGDLLLQRTPLDRVTGLSPEDAGDAGTYWEALMGSGSTMSFTLAGDLIGDRSGAAKDLMKNIYVVLTDTDSGQVLGLVCAAEANVVLEQGTAELALYDAAYSPEGTIMRGELREDGVILRGVAAEDPVYITAIVFLNGDTLTAGAASATQHPSLYGTINLQFASSATLEPMPYSGYYGG